MESTNLPNWLKKRAFLTPERAAIHFNGETWTFQQLYDRSVQVAGQLAGLEIKRNVFAGVLLKNHIDTVFILFALQLIGVKAVILNNRLPAEELAWQLQDSSSAFLITEKEFALQAGRTGSILEGVKIINKEDLFISQAAGLDLVEEFDLNDVCTVMYTSGTTGYPKGVLQSYGNHWWSAMGSALNLSLAENDCWLCAVPLFHISGYSILIRSVIYGMAIVLHETFDEKQTVYDINSKRVTIMSVVSPMLSRILLVLNGEEQRLPGWFRCMLLGGGPAPLPLLEGCEAKGIPVFQTYGMTETASQIVTLSPEYSLSRLGSAGKPLFPAQLKIINENGLENAAGEAGEIIVKGPNVTRGYLKRELETRKKIRDGWLYTGDIGYVDADGFLYVLDRRSDLIISGGENIYPAQVEAVLLSHKKVAEAGVIGLEDEKWGQVPVAFVVPKLSARVKEEELLQFCLQKLAKYKVPKKIFFVDKLPRNAANKLMRRKLLELLE